MDLQAGSATVKELWSLPRPLAVPEAHYSVFTFLCCWRIWKHQNEVVFRAEEPSLLRLLRDCKEDAHLWAGRLPRSETHIVDSWCSIFNPM
ncbi:hypothetical protein HU200_048313 [Digitaria exilis]|uniref:Uncharacterized protein n=1 Tax=Digitaria exilis TaxID=1010633 RepID=A0A835EDB2_9POAL|nr:hypothetical protein HU200_048313 [Digitaria exilis]